jgi:hypothetical protein
MRGFVFAVMLALLGSGSAVAQGTSLEDGVKASFIFNFIRYAQWPPAALSPSSSFTICIVGDAFQGIMQDTVRGEKINGSPINVREVTQAAASTGCHLIYFRESANRETVLQILNAAKALPILTVGETPEFLSSGGIVRFTKIANRIHFEINPTAAERVSLAISSRLLRLADIVRLQ